MKKSHIKIAHNVLLPIALGVISLILLIDVKPSQGASSLDQSSTPCNKYASVPEPYPFVGILAFGILGGGYLFKQRLRKKGARLNNDRLLPINDFYTSNNQQYRQLSFINSDEPSEDNLYRFCPSLELQLIEPMENIPSD
ncbi:hypothetical protein [Nostoc sp. ChiSLP03a]|uniref:hypothetical protein n=1 Tax=Nostoc sp. ChiSLP03a TaxID=3075380 RepID=UPI002AD254AC|nr:hypothetical protein [Nostoc sp. ChiSLP03a]MDZ8213353.1 hypothetical protein [Nostoc sp. ChiSLP03a]